MLILLTFFVVLIFDTRTNGSIIKIDQTLFNSSKNDSNQTVSTLNVDTNSTADKMSTNKSCLENSSQSINDGPKEANKIDQVPQDIIFINNDTRTDTESDFCLINRRSQDYRFYRPNSPIKCKINTNLANIFKPIKQFNISLMLFYDNIFAKKSHDPERDLKYMIKGLQEVYTSYDMINEIGLIKFYVHKVKRLDPFLDDLININEFNLIFDNFISNRNDSLPSKVIPIWFTGSNLYATNKQSKLKRIEGVGLTYSFCNMNPAILLNCNSINKAIITLSHEVAHVLGSDHDEAYLKGSPENKESKLNSDCLHDSKAFLMAMTYSTKRNLLSAVSRAQIAKKLDESSESCLTKLKKNEYGFEDLNELEALSLDEQCEISYSTRFQSDQGSFEDPSFCERLRCKLGFIKLSNFPVMNGTPCNKNSTMACCFGKCLINCRYFNIEK